MELSVNLCLLQFQKSNSSSNAVPEKRQINLIMAFLSEHILTYMPEVVSLLRLTAEPLSLVLDKHGK